MKTYIYVTDFWLMLSRNRNDNKNEVSYIRN